MIGAAYIYGICVSLSEWRNIWTLSLMIWFFVPFLIASKTFTIPEFLERRYNIWIRQFFAVITIVTNILAFLAAVLYGGGLALHLLFGWPLAVAIIVLAVVAGSWAIYGGLRSVAWTDFFTVIIMLLGGILVTVLGLQMLGENGSIIDGFNVMIQRNQADKGPWLEAVSKHAQTIVGKDYYNRLSVFQPVTHHTHPWPFIVFGFLSVSIWYNVVNQFMIQRVLGAKNIYHARMGIVLAGYLKALLPLITVLPGLILFARFPDVIHDNSWLEVRAQANNGFVKLVQLLVPAGLRGLILAALFGAIQSTINSVLNSTSTVFTLDIWKRWVNPSLTNKASVKVGVISSIIILIISIILAMFFDAMKRNLFVLIQALYAFFAPPFSAIFLLGILWRRINAKGACSAIFTGFCLAVGIKIWLKSGAGYPAWIGPYEMQSILVWSVSSIVCIVVSLLTVPPAPEKISDDLTFRIHNLNLKAGLGQKWYKSVPVWWIIFVIMILSGLIVFSGLVL
jgi:SSS family solute:Na+ symporter